jgi:hypothetical protein
MFSVSSVHLHLCYARTGSIILALLELLCLSLSALSARRSFCRSDSIISFVLTRLLPKMSPRLVHPLLSFVR